MFVSTIFFTQPVFGVGAENEDRVLLIYDTDMGNDIDDVLALGVIHALISRNEAELLAVTLTHGGKLSAPFVDAVNTFYGRPDIPIGVAENAPNTGRSRFTHLVNLVDGESKRYPYHLGTQKKLPLATDLLRAVLMQQSNHSVVIIQVGFSTNLASLLASPADQFSSLTGHELVRQKVKALSIMAGAFDTVNGESRYLEYNVVKDINSAKKLVSDWPTPVVFSGYEVGHRIRYPSISLESHYNYVEHHPLKEAYILYRPPPHDRPTWDLTSVLYAVRPNGQYFDLSNSGWVTVEDDGYTRFDRNKEGLHRFLIVNDARAHAVKELLVSLASQPPSHFEAN